MGIILTCTCSRVPTRPLPKGSHRGAADVSDRPWSLQRTDGEELTQVRGQRSWISVSGFRGDCIFYRQALLACAGDRWDHIAFEYPSNAKGSRRILFGALLKLLRRLKTRAVTFQCPRPSRLGQTCCRTYPRVSSVHLAMTVQVGSTTARKLLMLASALVQRSRVSVLRAAAIICST